MMKSTDLKIRFVLAALSLVALLVGFRAMLLQHLPGVFGAEEEDLAHGWYVPLFSLYVLWVERDKLLRSWGRPSLAAALAMVPFLFLGLLGARGLQVRFELLSFIGLLVLLPWAYFGRETGRRFVFPALFLLFCMPLASAMAVVTVPLRWLVTAVSAGVLSGFGMDLVRTGNLIELTGVTMANGSACVVNIADPCSGLRSIFALMALAAGYGYFSQPTWVRRALLFALAIPLAMLGNVVRIMSICVSAKLVSPSFALGTCHDVMGFVVFFMAMGLLIAASAFLDRCFSSGKAADAAPAGDHGAEPSARSFAARLAPILAFFLLVPAMSFQTMTPQPLVVAAPSVTIPSGLSARLSQPVVLPIEGRKEFLKILPNEVDFVGVPYGASEAELAILTGATVSHSAFRPRHELGAALPPLFQVSTVVSGPDKQSLHRPELCLPSQGFDIVGKERLTVDGIDWQCITLSEPKGRHRLLSAYTFFNQDGYRTDSHAMRILVDTWDRTVHNRVDRWAMVTVQVNVADEVFLRSVLKSLGGMIK